VITDRDLDARLAGAAGIDDQDLPALPEDFLPLLTGEAGATTREATPASEPASVIAARQLVSDARSAGTAPRMRRRPGRRTMLRAGTAVMAIVAAWLTAVVVTPSDRDTTHDAPPGATPRGGISLVAGEEVTFPLTLSPAPEGLTPEFSRAGGVPYYGDQPVVFTADYMSPDGDRVLLTLFPEDPRDLGDDRWVVDGPPTGTAAVAATKAEVWNGKGYVSLLWKRPDGRWIGLLGEGTYAKTAALVAVGNSVVDRPQPIGLRFGLAPAGWSVGGYEENRSLDLVSDTAPDQLLRVSVYTPGPGTTIDTLIEGNTFAGPVETVTFQGQPGRLAPKKGDVGQPDYWFAVGQLPGGRIFLLLAPETLTREQVTQIADQITSTP
jgi:hypothetical protein